MCVCVSGSCAAVLYLQVRQIIQPPNNFFKHLSQILVSHKNICTGQEGSPSKLVGAHSLHSSHKVTNILWGERRVQHFPRHKMLFDTWVKCSVLTPEQHPQGHLFIYCTVHFCWLGRNGTSRALMTMLVPSSPTVCLASKSLHRFLEQEPSTNALVRTTTALTIFNAGVKVPLYEFLEFVIKYN